MDHFSISQVKMAERCPRLWLAKYRENRGGGGHESPALAYGKELHDAAEKYIKHGVLPEDHKFSVFCKELLTPMPDVPHYVELPLHPGSLAKRPDTGGLLDLGKQDALFSAEVHGVPFWGFVDYVEVRDEYIVIVDHKTVKSQSYATKEAGLEYDLQMLAYSYFLLQHFKDHPGVVVGHNNLSKNVRWTAFKTRLYLRRAHVEDYFHKVIEPMCARMIDLWNNQSDWLSAENNNERGCYAFGKCQMFDVCHGLDIARSFGFTL